jgi:hypothetical protein
MRALLILLASLGVVVAVHAADVVTGRVIKVLPFLVDQQGRIAKSPSLFDRDAYQAYLLQHTNEVSGMRFDVQWKAVKSPDEKLKLQVELRGVTTNTVPTMKTMVTNVVAGTYSQWTYIPLAGQDYKSVGTVAAWRVTLWNDSQMLGEQKSFLW